MRRRLAQSLTDAKRAGWHHWIRSEADEAAVREGCYFCRAAALRVRRFFRDLLVQSKGQWAGKPFVLMKWQWRDIIAPLFGWKRADGTRRYRRGYIEVPKKNGKSTLCSGISVYMLVADGEPGAEVYNLASDKDQASVVFDEAANMVEASPELLAALQVVRSTKRIVFPARRSVLRALTADPRRNFGRNASATIIDELLAQRNRELFDAMRFAGIARRQPLFLSITTAGELDLESICWEEHDYARQILDGTLHDSAFFAFIAAADKDDDWTNVATWRKANPSFGITISPSEVADAIREAKNSPRKKAALKRDRLNVWGTLTGEWLSIEQWDACEPPLSADELILKPCFGGLDLSSTTDLAAFVLAFPLAGGFDLLVFIWAPEEACKTRERKNKARLDHWVELGLIKQTAGNVIDYDVIRADINALGEEYDIRKLGIDRWNATQLATQLQGDGFNVVLFGQGFASMNAPAKEFERLLAAGKLRHGNNPVLNWMARNARCEEDAAGNIKPSKGKSPEKIDGIVAACNALGVAIAEPPEPEPPSVTVWKW